MIGLTLGAVSFAGFELPGAIAFGGRQAMNVHQLFGGGRVIDTLGPDDGEIGWAGVLAGGTAGDRARLLDGMRANGAALPLQWDAFSFVVVISDLHLSYRGPWWIPYRIRCTVVTESSAVSASTGASVLSAIIGDLDAAGALFGIGGVASAAVQSPSALVAGTLANASATRALEATGGSISAALTGAEAGMGGSQTLGALAATAGTMAGAAAAQGYLGRALDNLRGAED